MIERGIEGMKDVYLAQKVLALSKASHPHSRLGCLSMRSIDRSVPNGASIPFPDPSLQV
jgi:hypothetical protein